MFTKLFKLFTLFQSITNYNKDYDIISWYVDMNSNTNETDISNLDNIRWDLHTHIRIGSLKVSQNGTVNCGDNYLMNEAIKRSKYNNTNIIVYSEVDIEKCAFNDINSDYCNNYFNSLHSGIRECGPLISGIEFDYEWKSHINIIGYINETYIIKFSEFLDKTQKLIGDNYTVSCDVSVYFLPYTRWVDSYIFNSNPNLFVNSMSYYYPRDCSIDSWKKDAWVIHNEWGINKKQINIGTNIFTMYKPHNSKNNKFLFWQQIVDMCPYNTDDKCICENIPYASPDMHYQIGKFVKENGYRGVFPWAASYDSVQKPLVQYIYNGLYS